MMCGDRCGMALPLVLDYSGIKNRLVSRRCNILGLLGVSTDPTSHSRFLHVIAPARPNATAQVLLLRCFLPFHNYCGSGI